MNKLSVEQLKALSHEYEELDPNLSAIIIALSTCRLVEERIGTSVPETQLLRDCMENSKQILDSIRLTNLFFGDDHKADLN